MIMPLVYFYTEDGACIRALLYGFLHWIIDGTAKEILSRKLLLTAHRGRFEAALLQHKQELVKRISRRIGSGPEVIHSVREGGGAGVVGCRRRDRRIGNRSVVKQAAQPGWVTF